MVTGGFDRGAFELLAADRVKRGIGNLGSPAVQAELDPWLECVELLILDNLSSLTVGLRENDSDDSSQACADCVNLSAPGRRSSNGCCSCAGAGSRC